MEQLRAEQAEAPRDPQRQEHPLSGSADPELKKVTEGVLLAIGGRLEGRNA